jgi:hypothetical protein
LADTPADTCVKHQFHNRSLADPHTKQALAQALPLLEEPIRIGVGPSEQGGECPKPGSLACSHGTFLHMARQTLKPPAPLHYISRDHPIYDDTNPHELTNYIRHPVPEPGLRSPGAPGKWLRRWCGIVPVSATGTIGRFLMIL